MSSSDKSLQSLPGLRRLRWFAVSWGAMSCAAGLVLAIYCPGRIYWLLAMGLVLYFVVGVIRPSLVRPAYRLADWALSPLGRLVSFCGLALVYYLFFTGYALVLKIMQRELLCLRPEDKSCSGWCERQLTHRQESLYWQY